MADRTVQVRLKVTDEFSSSVDRYGQKMRQAEQATASMNTAASRSQAAFRGMGTAISGAVVAFGAIGAIRLAEDIYASGMAAQRAELLFRSFGAQVGDMGALLERLRGTTRGVVGDIDLMNAASSMMSMGLARNADEVERLTNIGVTFAQAMGQDVGASLQNLNMLLANQSYLRLDTLGISSSQVRELAGQYRAAGMDSSEAFTAAFMDVAEDKLPQMAAVADATVTEIQKLQISMDNWWADFGNRFAQGVNGMIGIATNAGPIIRAALFGEASAQAGIAAANDQALQSMANAQANVWFDQLGGGDLSADNPYRMTDIEQRSGWIASLMAASRLQDRPVSDFSAQDVANLTGNAGTYLIAEQIKEWAAGGLESLNRSTQWAAESQAALALATEQLTTSTEAAADGFRLSPGVSDPAAVRRGEMMNNANVWMQAIRAQMGQNASPFMTGEDAYSVGQAAIEVQRFVDEALRLNDINPGFLSEQNVTLLSQMAAEAGATADQAERMALALENASLSQLFGQTGGGRAGEISSGLIATLQAQGLGGDALQGLQDALFLNSGQETQASLQYRDEVLPMIADIYTQFGQDAAITALNAYNEAVAAAGVAGQGAMPLDLTGALGYAYTMPGTGGTFTVNPGDTPGAVAAREGMTVDDVLAATGATSAYTMPVGTFGMAGGGDLVQITQDAADNVAEAATNATGITDEMTTAVDTLAAGVEGVFSRTYQLPIELVISGGGVLAQMIAAAVAGSGGGTVPGTSPHTGRSATGSGTRGAAIRTAD